MPFSVDDSGHSRRIVPAASEIRFSGAVDVGCEGVLDPLGPGAAAGEFGLGVGSAGAGGLVVGPGVGVAGVEFPVGPGVVDTTAGVAVGPKVGIAGAEFPAVPGVVDTTVEFVVERTA
jgi:hypothetical protein